MGKKQSRSKRQSLRSVQAVKEDSGRSTVQQFNGSTVQPIGGGASSNRSNCSIAALRSSC
jgi:hypothetical protein